MQVDVSDEGRTRVRETYQISAPVNGKLLRVEVHPGDVVEAGKTKIAELLPIAPSFLDVRTRAQAEAGVKAAEAGRNLAAADLRRARAELTFAASELKRAQALGTSGFISKANLERAQLTRDTAAAQVATAQAALYAKNFELDSARALLLDPTDKAAQRTQQGVPIVAPVSGSVLHVLHESESVLQAGTVIADIGDPHQLEIVAELISEDAVKVHVGDKATITDWGGTVPLNARVRRIEPSGFTKLSALGVEEQRVNVLLDFTDPPARLNRVADGYRVVVHVTVWSAPRVLSVPVAALFRNGSGWAVFVLRNGRAALAPVSIDHSNDDIAEVRSGLRAGDAVVLHPSDQIADGTRITGRIP
jgi:HlyD family secretion protein